MLISDNKFEINNIAAGNSGRKSKSLQIEDSPPLLLAAAVGSLSVIVISVGVFVVHKKRSANANYRYEETGEGEAAEPTASPPEVEDKQEAT